MAQRSAPKVSGNFIQELLGGGYGFQGVEHADAREQAPVKGEESREAD